MTSCRTEKGTEADLHTGKGFDEGTPLGDADELQVFIRGRAQGLDDELQLMDVVFAREERLPVQQLRQDAAHRPAHEGQALNSEAVCMTATGAHSAALACARNPCLETAASWKNWLLWINCINDVHALHLDVSTGME
jgi:hypothetical protein